MVYAPTHRLVGRAATTIVEWLTEGGRCTCSATGIGFVTAARASAVGPMGP